MPNLNKFKSVNIIYFKSFSAYLKIDLVNIKREVFNFVEYNNNKNKVIMSYKFTFFDYKMSNLRKYSYLMEYLINIILISF